MNKINHPLGENDENAIEDRVAIIGGGLCGMLCKKWLKDFNCEADLYDEKESFFGIWNKKEGKTWDDMKANLSQLSCQFSDHLWEIKQPYLPSSDKIRSYLLDYVAKFKLDEGNNYFKSRIQSVVQDETTELYKLEIFDLITNKVYIRRYRKVVVATGFQESYDLPIFKGFEKFTGDYIHSTDYKNTVGLEKKKVLIVGMSYSGGNICDEIGEVTESKVILSCREPSFIIENEILDPVTGKTSTNDSRALRRRTDGVPDLYGSTNVVYDIFWSYVEKQMKVYEDLDCLKLKYGQILRTSFSHKLKLVNFIRQKKVEIAPVIKEFHDNNLIEFVDGRTEQIDTIIFCTGFKTSLNFLDEKIRNDVSYSPEKHFHPITCYRGIYNNKHKNLMFIGMQTGIYWIGMELQARYAAGLLTGKYDYPDEQKYNDIIQKEINLRESGLLDRVKMSYPYILYIDTLANDMGILPDIKQIKEEDYELYQSLMSITPNAVNYRITKEDSYREENIAYLKRVFKELN